jgi:hypothetical protein
MFSSAFGLSFCVFRRFSCDVCPTDPIGVLHASLCSQLLRTCVSALPHCAAARLADASGLHSIRACESGRRLVRVLHADFSSSNGWPAVRFCVPSGGLPPALETVAPEMPVAFFPLADLTPPAFPLVTCKPGQEVW